jgi:hypothetical protein
MGVGVRMGGCPLVMLLETVQRAGLAELLASGVIEHRDWGRADGMQAEGIPLDGDICSACGWAGGLGGGAGHGAGLARVSVVALVMHLLGGRSLGAEALVASEAVEDAAVVVMVVVRNAEHVRGYVVDFLSRIRVSGRLRVWVCPVPS